MKEDFTQGPTYGASAHYDASYFAWQNSHMEIKVGIKVQRFRPYVRETDTVLDFGCAGGALLGALPGKRKIGVELNEVAREAAVRDFGIEAYRSMTDVPDGVADVIVSNHTLEHIAAPLDALIQMKRKLKPGGLLVLVLPIDDWRAQRKWDPKDINRHLYTWTPLNLGHLLTEAGFRPDEMRVIRQTLMRGFHLFAKLPEPIFTGMCSLYSRLRHRQELLATARPEATRA